MNMAAHIYSQVTSQPVILLKLKLSPYLLQPNSKSNIEYKQSLLFTVQEIFIYKLKSVTNFK